jgi:hypothetical protein
MSLIIALLVSQAARAAHIEVDLSSQTMRVSSNQGDYVWPISSARPGYSTPRGTYGVQRLEVMHRSRKYHNSPMPHSIFFHGGYAIHGTYETAALGEPASHGCVRIAPQNAALLFQLIKAEGASITITGSPVGATRYARADHRHHHATRYAARHLHPQALGYASEPRGIPTLEDWLRAPSGE